MFMPGDFRKARRSPASLLISTVPTVVTVPKEYFSWNTGGGGGSPLLPPLSWEYFRHPAVTPWSPCCGGRYLRRRTTMGRKPRAR
jgi:hypothetical protein